MSSVQRQTQELIVSMLNAEAMSRVRWRGPEDPAAYPLLRQKEYDKQSFTFTAAPRPGFPTATRMKLPPVADSLQAPADVDQSAALQLKQSEVGNLRKELQELNAKYLEVIRSQNQAQIDHENASLQIDKMVTNDQSQKSSIDLLLAQKAKIIADFEAQKQGFKAHELQLLKQIEALDFQCKSLYDERKQQDLQAESLYSQVRSQNEELTIVKETYREQVRMVDEQNKKLIGRITEDQRVIERYQMLLESFDFQQQQRQINQLVASLRDISSEQLQLQNTVENIQTADIFDLIFETFGETKTNLLAGNKTTVLTQQLKDAQFQLAQLRAEHDTVLSGIQEVQQLNESFKSDVGAYLQEKVAQLQKAQAQAYQLQGELKNQIQLLQQQNDAKTAEMRILEDMTAYQIKQLNQQLVEATEQKLAQKEQLMAEKQQLQLQIVSSQREILELNGKLAESLAAAQEARQRNDYQHEQTNAEIARLRADLAKQREQTEDDAAVLRVNLQRYTAENDELRQQLAQAGYYLQTANQQLEQRQQKAYEIEQRLSLARENASYQETAYKQYVQELNQQLIQFQKQADQAVVESKQSTLKMTQSEAVLNEKIRGLDERLAHQDEVIKQQYAREQQLNRENVQLTTENKALADRIMKLESQLSQYDEQTQQLVAYYEAQLEERAGALDDTIKYLKASEAENYSVSQQLQELQAQFADLSAQAAELQSEIEKLSSRLAEAEQALELAENDKKALARQLEAVESAKAALEQQLSSTNEALVQAREQYNTTRQNAASDLESTTADLQRQLAEKNEQVKRLAQEFKNILQESEEIGAEVDAEIERFQAEIGAKNSEIQRQKQAFYDYYSQTRDVAQLSKQFTLQAQMIENLEETNSSIGAENKQLRTENANLKNVNSELRAVLRSKDVAREIQIKYAELLNSIQDAE